MNTPHGNVDWVIADTHFNHVNIAKYEPIRQTLGVDHNRFMIDQWRSAVTEGSTVLHVGDLVLGKPDDFMRIAEQLPGRKLLVPGNHDKQTKSWYRSHGFEVVKPFWIDYAGVGVHVTHEPDHEAVRELASLSLHGHVHSATLDDTRFINVSAEVIGFRPRNLDELITERIERVFKALPGGDRAGADL